MKVGKMASENSCATMWHHAQYYRWLPLSVLQVVSKGEPGVHCRSVPSSDQLLISSGQFGSVTHPEIDDDKCHKKH